MIRIQLHSNKATTNGFVLDLNFAKSAGKAWAERLIEKNILGPIKLTNIIEILLDDDEISLRAKNIRQNIETGQVFSKWERDELRKPKPVKLDDDGNPIVEDEEEELDEDGNPKKKLPAEFELVTRACDEMGPVLAEIDYYKNADGERKACHVFIEELYDSTFIKIDAAGLNPTELSDAVAFRVKPKVSEPLRPIAKIIEGGGDFKSLLTDEGNEEENIPPRNS